MGHRNPLAGLLHHSDRGSQYAATRDQLLLPTHGITTSISRRGNCWDNAWVERFFGMFKRERVSPRYDATRDDAKREIVEYREVFSNRQRRHSTFGDHFPGRVRSEDVRGVTRCPRKWGKAPPTWLRAQLKFDRGMACRAISNSDRSRPSKGCFPATFCFELFNGWGRRGTRIVGQNTAGCTCLPPPLLLTTPITQVDTAEGTSPHPLRRYVDFL